MKHIYVATIVLAIAFLAAFGGQSVADDQPDCHDNKGAQIGQGHTRDDSKNHQGKGKGHHKCESMTPSTPKPSPATPSPKPSPTSSPQATQSPAPTASPKASATPAGTATPTPKETSGGNTIVTIQRLPSTSTQ